MALASILAFWCGGGIRNMDTLFRQSGLMREKWDRSLSGSTYGAVTLEKAVASCAEFYKPITVHSASEDFNDVLQVLKTLHPESSDRYAWADIGASRLFADSFKSVARYVPERRIWFCYAVDIQDERQRKS